ncbi:alternative ribosome rescue aminoacyl-tRNA hydrolase ArfB [Flavobacterium sp.]|jgi:ribosome-associated protein|uniref:alternative ribosome rescue aminoacyl-tRNA hydrolase ArfB n=1 Tax=Flavobacterium sp. TaxID=239 RepID=UPI002A8213EE|nr:alternative ribosome rescue aminoacyl-tRNA hydrolase ArfB [Flavobacterium sp.]
MNKELIINELDFKAVRSSGAGGQNVNKVSSKVVLTFDLEKSSAISEDEKELLKNKLSSKLTQNNILILNCDEDRSQVKNKSIVIKRFFSIIEKGLHKPKIRRTTKAPRRVKEKRLNSKKIMSVLKQNRKKPNF